MWKGARRIAVLGTRTIFCAALSSSLPLSGAAWAQDAGGHGQQAFQAMCAACHTIGGGRLVGPDLQGISDRRDERWIIRFVQHSQALVQEGDSTAVALFEEFNGIP